MKNIILFFILFILFQAASFSQNFKGRVVTTSKEPVAGSSVYLEENKQGLICNGEGEFQATLLPGNYHCTFSCLGYETQSKEISIPKEGISPYVEIVLKEKAFELQEVVIDNSGEDPAYAIMRKTIEKAPFYLNLVKEYTCEAYVKGSGKSAEIPKLFKKMADEKLDIYENKLFLQESFSEVKFTAPDKYIQTVKAFSSTMPNDSLPTDAFGVATGSLYRPIVGTLVSPLNPKAFSYYKFRYEGYDEVDGVNINKIKVIPKLKDEKFIEGYLYIADDSWDIRHAELISHTSFVTANYNINYDQVVENVYLPVSFTSTLKLGVLGLKISMDYLASLKYTDIHLNDSLMAQLKYKEPQKKKEKKSLEIKRDEKFKKEADSLATKRDLFYWNAVRSISLNNEELQSYARKDTLQAYVDSVKQIKLHPRFKWSDILMGGQFGGDSSKVYFKYGGIIRAFPEYNFVDGFWIGQSIELGIKRKKNSWWKIKPEVYWTSARKQVVWDLDIDLTYAPMKLGKFSFSAGSTTDDYARKNGMLRIENAINSSFMGANNAKFYKKNYIRLENELDLANGLQWGIFGEIADRQWLDNHTTFSLFGSKADAEPNIPSYSRDLNGQYDALFLYGIRFKYTLEYYYEVIDGKKKYAQSRFPTFNLQFQNGVPSWLENSVFYRLDFSIDQKLKLGLFDQLFYGIAAGKFFNNNRFNYIDYKHFNAADQLITGKNFETSYSLLPYYTYSTSDKWIQAFATYNTKYLLLKRLPFLQGKIFSESIHGKYLYTPDKPNYSEWGYSVGLPDLGSVGVFVSFDAVKYNSWGVSISLPLLQMVGIKNKD